MQWLIDLVIEAIGIPPCYVDRGDPAAIDFSGAQLIADGAYHELDLSAIVPKGASAVHLALKLIHSAAGVLIRVREAGNVNEINVSSLFIQVTWIARYHDPIIKIGTDRKIEYKLSNVAWIEKGLTVRGWLL